MLIKNYSRIFLIFSAIISRKIGKKFEIGAIDRPMKMDRIEATADDNRNSSFIRQQKQEKWTIIFWEK